MIEQKTIKFSGYVWEVRSGDGDPGHNHWSSDNVWVDQDGYLHLKITQQDGIWYCAELSTTTSMGFGEYEFYIINRIDLFDPNIVFGLFNYPPASIGPDRTNETDIEISRWGNPTYPNGNFTVFPTVYETEVGNYTFNFSLNGSYTTHRFVWTSNEVHFQSFHGHGNDPQQKIDKADWLYKPENSQNIPQQPLPIHINLWLFDGQQPTDSQSVEVIVSKFQFTPSS
ncbi:MAG: glycoside hydrolase family 16 protein [Fischerella sp. CENA71]|nr:glycoside hydrolase family 16 protein [Fischerella sp. CENA71]